MQATARSRRNRGGATVAVVLSLALLMGLVSLFVHHHLLSGRRTATAQELATVAAHAADAGTDWTLGRLNGGEPVDEQCQPDPARPAQAPTFARQVMAAAHAGVVPPPTVAACTLDGAVWRCHCPTGTAAEAPQATTTRRATSFAVSVTGLDDPDQFALDAWGCSDAVEGCHPPDVPSRRTPANGAAGTGAPHPGGKAYTRVSVHRLPALSHLPAAALTVHGNLDTRAASWQVQAAAGTEASLALHAGAGDDGAGLVVVGPPGAPAASLKLMHDRALAQTPEHARFRSLFRLDADAWQTLPTVRRVPCHSPCDAALAEALGPGLRHPLVWLEGGLRLAGPATLGAPDHPVVVVAAGPVQVDRLRVHGLVYLRHPQWKATEAHIQGAVVAEQGLAPHGTANVVHDPVALSPLRDRDGTYLRILGSWKDF